MLKKYSIENFKSIKLKETILFEARPYKKRDFKLLNNELLPVIAIYGPNGGGKSAIVQSIGFLVNYLLFSNNMRFLNDFFNALHVFKNINKKDGATVWDIEIISDANIQYKYHLSININSKESIVIESLYYKEMSLKKSKEKLVFERTNNNIKCGETLKKININKELIFHNSVLTYINNNFNNELINDFWNSITKINVIDNLRNDPSSILNLNYNYNFDYNVLINEKKKFLKIFKELDINIVDILIKKDPIGNLMLGFKKRIDGKEVELPFEFESNGTKKIIQLLTFFVKSMRNNHIFVFDELDSQLHTKLLGYIIDMFNFQKDTNSQLIFTSHDIGTLDTDYFREDEIYFAALNEMNFTDTICLSEYGSEIRKGSSISNKYLNGELGYDPYIERAKEVYEK